MSLLDQFFVYHPEPWQDRDWARLSRVPLEDVWFQAADGARLFGWYVEAEADRPVILWCYGNAGRIINRLENLRELYRIGLSVFIFNITATGGVREGHQRKASAKGAFDSTFQLRFLEAIRQLELRCRRLLDLIWTAPPQQRCGHARGG